MAQDLATLKIVVDATGAIRTVEQLNTSLDENAKVAKQSEAAALASGRSWQSVAGAGRTATQVTGTLARQQVALANASTASGRQMSVAAQRSLMLADAMARGSLSGATLSARILGLGSAASMVMGPAGIAVVAATGFAALVARIGDEAKAAREELEKFSRVTFANRDLDAAGRRFVRAREGDPEADTELGRASRGAMQAELDKIIKGATRVDTMMAGDKTVQRTLVDLTRAETLRVKALREAIALRVEEEKVAQALIDKLAPLKVAADKFAEDEERRLKAARENARLAEEWAESLKRGAANAALIDQMKLWDTNVLNRNRSVARSIPGTPSTGDPLAPIGLPGGGISPHRFWRGVNQNQGATAVPDPEKEVSAFGGLLARTVSDSIGDGITSGLKSAGPVARVFGDLMSSAISESLTGKLTESLSGVFKGPLGIALGVGGLLLGRLFGRGRREPVGPTPNERRIIALNQQVTRLGLEADARDTSNQIRTGVASVLTESTAMRAFGTWEAIRRIEAEALAVSKAILVAVTGGTAGTTPSVSGAGSSASLKSATFDRELGQRSASLRLMAGSAVIA